MRALAALGCAFFALGVGGAAYGHGAAGPTFTGGYGPVWSPDGTQIAYIGPIPNLLSHPPTDGFNHVLVVEANGSGAPKVVATEPACPHLAGTVSCQDPLGEVRWAAGERFVYDIPQGRLWSRAGNVVTRLGQVGSAGGDEFSVSRDGREVTLTAPCGCKVPQGTEVQFVPAAGGAVHALPHPKHAIDSEPSFSPDGRNVAFSRFISTDKGGPFIEVAGVRSGAARSLGVSGFSPVFSPNGRWIAFTGRRGIEVVPAEGGSARTLLAARCCSFSAAYSWSPDSQTLAYVSGAHAGTISLSGAKILFRLPDLQADSHVPQWSPDGKTIAFSVVRKGDDLGNRVYLINADGSGLRRLA